MKRPPKRAGFIFFFSEIYPSQLLIIFIGFLMFLWLSIALGIFKLSYISFFNVTATQKQIHSSSRLELSCLPLASTKEVILWLGEKPCSALQMLALPPERAPRGRAPVGVKPFSCSTDSDSSLTNKGEKMKTRIEFQDTRLTTPPWQIKERNWKLGLIFQEYKTKKRRWQAIIH